MSSKAYCCSKGAALGSEAGDQGYEDFRVQYRLLGRSESRSVCVGGLLFSGTVSGMIFDSFFFVAWWFPSGGCLCEIEQVTALWDWCHLYQ